VVTAITTDDIARALQRLGVEREPPTAAALHRIHRAFVARVPYETVWIHMDERLGIEPMESFRRVFVAQRGGYCYQLNGALSVLLTALGYRVTRHVGGVHGPEGPDENALTNHLVLVAHDLPTETNPAGEWYVDVGLGDGLHEPLPLLAGEYDHAPMHFVLARTDDGIGDWHLTHDPTGAFTGMSFRLPPVDMEVFAARHEYLSRSPESNFAGVVTAHLRPERGTTILRGCVLTRRIDDTATTETVDERAAWFTMLDDVFGIRSDAPHPALDALWKRVEAAHEAYSRRGDDT
jgi:N-hydroxyarylamine O-acetyltransferase